MRSSRARVSAVCGVWLGLCGWAPGTDCDTNGVDDARDIADGGRGLAPGTIHDAPGTPESVAIADFDGDGDPDLAVACFDSARVRLYANDGTGALAGNAVPGGAPAGAGSTHVAAADLDGDGDPDLAVVNQAESTLSVLLNDGDWTFAPQVKYPVGAAPVVVCPVDLDGDGDLDLAVANYKGSSVTLLENLGGGAFEDAGALDTPVSEFGPISIVGRDLDGDGDADLAVANDRPKNVSIFENEGGEFTGPTNYPVGVGFDPRGEPNSLTSGDFDGDGDPDLATANWASNTVSVLLNDGGGAFAPPVNYPAGPVPTSIAHGDLDGDGDLDLVAVNGGDQEIVSVYWNDGSGALGREDQQAAGDGAFFVALGDLDGDGFPDVAVASRLTSDLRVYLNVPAEDRDTDGTLDRCQSPRRGDANQDGVVDLSDSLFVLHYLYVGGGAPPCSAIADLNGDQSVNASDSRFGLSYLFSGGVSLPDMTSEEALRCGSYAVAAPPPLARVAFGFQAGASNVAGSPGQLRTFEVFATLETSETSTHRGAQGWSLGVEVVGGRVVEASLEGIVFSIVETTYDPLTDTPLEVPADALGPYFAETTASDSFAVSAVALPVFDEFRSLARTGSQRLCRLTIETTIPEEGTLGEVVLRFRDGLRGSGQPVRNVVCFGGISQVPALGALTVPVRAVSGGAQLPGDANQDGVLDLSDPVWLLAHLFLGLHPELPCEGGVASSPGPGELLLLDLNGDERIDLSDAVFALTYLFNGGPSPLPGTECMPIAGCPAVATRCGG